MKYYAYMLLCSDNTIYSGFTTDIRKREEAHNSGKAAKYTRCRLPAHMVYYEDFETKSEAMSREAAFKKLKRKEKEALIESFSFKYPD